MKNFKNFISESAKKTKPVKTKYLAYRYDGPYQNKVIDKTTFHASSKEAAKQHVINWMEKIGMNPHDEDDYASILWRPHEKGIDD